MRELNYKPIILIVDDMPTNILILSDLLKDEYQIKVTNNGQRALEISRGSEKPDLILLDIEMPDMDGYEVCKALKNSSDTYNIPIIFVTAKSDVKDEEYGLNLGAVDYISKPFHPTIVRIRVKNHIALKLKSDCLEELSMLDGLTHIPNRRYFNEHYEILYKESLREETALCVLMLDVDFFKRYNDHYGHGKGDECLIKIATALKNRLKRPSDVVARYGGEEFVVILKDIDYEGAKIMAQSLLEAVRELTLEHEYSDVSKYVTISIGMAFEENTNKSSKEEILKKADDALYSAKEKGRNKFL